MKLACIADDFTGATDVANNLVRAGMRVVQTIGLPRDRSPIDADAVVVALKSRTTPAADAVAESVAACEWLRALSPEAPPQIYFKYCSTFDSTAQGNIGPVTEALMAATGAPFTVATPAFPDNGRSVFKGHLFVGDALLSDSSMRDHPLTPMTDANLVRVLQAQCATQKVGLVEHRVVSAGAAAVRERFAQLQQQGVGIAILDAVDNDALITLGQACADLPLVTAGSGLAIGLPGQWGFAANREAGRLPAAHGKRAILAGSCSSATQRQIADYQQQGGAAYALDPLRIAQGEDVAGAALQWAAGLLEQDRSVLIYSTADAATVKAIQARLGTHEAGAMVERTLATIARGLMDLQVRQLIVAGGETSGACVQALGIERLLIGPQIDPGVPWCHARSDAIGADEGLHLTLKSGNFGADDFFTKAFQALQAA